jgi:hypothetical protein
MDSEHEAAAAAGCAEARAVLQERVSGLEVSPARMRAVDNHACSCPRCWELVSAVLDDLPPALDQRALTDELWRVIEDRAASVGERTSAIEWLGRRADVPLPVLAGLIRLAGSLRGGGVTAVAAQAFGAIVDRQGVLPGTDVANALHEAARTAETRVVREVATRLLPDASSEPRLGVATARDELADALASFWLAPGRLAHRGETSSFPLVPEDLASTVRGAVRIDSDGRLAVALQGLPADLEQVQPSIRARRPDGVGSVAVATTSAKVVDGKVTLLVAPEAGPVDTVAEQLKLGVLVVFRRPDSGEVADPAVSRTTVVNFVAMTSEQLAAAYRSHGPALRRHAQSRARELGLGNEAAGDAYGALGLAISLGPANAPPPERFVAWATKVIDRRLIDISRRRV